ncbi:MAG: hypothetical protein ABEJ67_00905 [Halanaeroarchaeum sp.]
MQVSSVYLAMSVIGGLGLFVVWLLIRGVRQWSFPVRRRSFDFVTPTDAIQDLAERGPSGKVDGEITDEAAEAETEEGEPEEGGEAEADEAEAAEEPDRAAEPELTFWERVKMHLYTYQKRPR